MLDRVSRTNFGEDIQIYAYLNDLPEIQEQISGKRVDITLVDAAVSDEIKTFPTDDIIIKTLVKATGGNVTLSLFFRYEPQEVTISADTPDTLVIDIVPGNRFTSSYRHLIDELETTFHIPYGKPYPLNPVDQSPFAGNWLSFFSSYQPEVSIEAPLSVYIPPFPWIGLIEKPTNESDYPYQLVESLPQHDWFRALAITREALKNSSTDNRQKFLLFLHADILYRLGNINGSENQLKHLVRTYPDESLGIAASYVSSLIEARKGRYHLSQAGLKRLLAIVDYAAPIKERIHLSLLETALALKQTDLVAKLVSQHIAVPDELINRLKIRTADALWFEKEYEPALHYYGQIIQDSDLSQLPYSLHGFCSTLLENRRFESSALCYRNLANTLVEEEQKGAAVYQAAAISSANHLSEQAATLLDHIIVTYPDTLAASRAELQRIDQCITDDPACMDNAMNVYQRLSTNVQSREISSEARFRKALIHHLQGNDRSCVDELMILLRTYRSGTIREHAHALLVQTLPVVIGDLIEAGNDGEAITIARQNRFVFENRWVDFAILSRLPPALERQGLYREAIALLLFLAGEYPQADQHKIHLELTRLGFLQGNLYLVEDVSSNYFHNYPEGRFYNDILSYRIEMEYRTGRIEQAAERLPDPLPEGAGFSYLAASIYYQLDNYDKCAAILLPLHKGLLPDDQLMIAAESLFALGRFDEARLYFLLLEDVSSMQDLALYRLSQIEQIRTGGESEHHALIKLAESRSTTPWQRFATRQLRYIRLMDML